MNGRFLPIQALDAEQAPFGSLRWLCRPGTTGAANLTVIEVRFRPGEGHSFHHHPGQEEVIVAVAGTVEQWIGEERRLLVPGDAAFMPPGCVHATFNDSDAEATLLAILGPAVGEAGYEAVDVWDQAPWNTLRGLGARS